MQVDEHIVCDRLAFPEGPCAAPNGDIYFVELPRGCVARNASGERETVADLGGSPNGAKFGSDGTLFVANGGGNWPPVPATNMRPGLGGGTPSLQSVRPDGSIATLLTRIDGVSLSAPNDLCLDRLGNVYFTDPVWAERDSNGVAAADASPPGSVCFYGSDGVTSRLHTGLLFPNGIQLDVSGARLFVAETGTGDIHVFPVLGPGRLGQPRIFCKLGVDSGVDGMCLDAAGRLLVAGCGSGTVFVIDTNGDLTEKLEFQDRSLTNLCFGADPHVLYVTAAWSGTLIRTRRETPGPA
jgi:gluconolactonase